jgi:uncharacterized LabA/DUF88 family protein
VTVAEPRLKIAVFIDFDNIEIGVKSTLNSNLDIGLVLDALKERGEVVSKTAYSDWKRAGDYSRSLTQHAIKMVQRNLTPGGDKNGADINLALDALEMAFTHPHINAYVIVGGDSDFISLVEKLKQYDKKVLVVGGRSFTSAIMQRNCHEFIAYENLVTPGNGRRSAERGSRAPRTTHASVEHAIPLVQRALEVLTDREVSPQLGLLKSTLLQLDSTFSERSYGASSFRDFAEKLEAANVVTLRHSGRNILVELKGAGDAADIRVPEPPAAAEPAPRADRPPGGGDVEVPPVTGGIADVRRIFARSKPQRFPMYIRNVKQLLRQTEPGFDERRYGFANLVDLLRAAQREGIVRLERDRQGALRVFQGPQWAGAAGPVEVVTEPIEATTISVESAAIGDASGPAVPVVEAEVLPSEPVSQPEKRRTRKPKAAGLNEETPKRKPRTAKTSGGTSAKRRTRKPQTTPQVTVE